MMAHLERGRMRISVARKMPRVSDETTIHYGGVVKDWLTQLILKSSLRPSVEG